MEARLSRAVTLLADGTVNDATVKAGDSPGAGTPVVVLSEQLAGAAP